MLPQQRTSAAADMGRLAVHDHPRRQKEARRGSTIHQLHYNRRFERRKREEQEKRSNELAPDKEREPHPGKSFGAELNDGGDKIHRPEERGSN